MENATVRDGQSVSAKSRLIGLMKVCDRIDRSRWWVERAVKAGNFPKPVIQGRATKFLEQEIDRYIDDLVAARDREAA
jgi:predicted DNA-binding transcriptional regulator AlpA